MSFRLPKDGEVYVPSKLSRMTRGEKLIVREFDIYYAGAMLGLCARERTSEEAYLAATGRELTRSYPREREEQRDTIAGMLIEAELARQDIEPGNAAVILGIVGDCLSYGSSTRLTQFGHQLLDRYAAGGFRLLRERYPSPFTYEEDFLSGYLALLNEVCGDDRSDAA